MRKEKREKVNRAKDEEVNGMDKGGKKAGKGVPRPHAGSAAAVENDNYTDAADARQQLPQPPALICCCSVRHATPVNASHTLGTNTSNLTAAIVFVLAPSALIVCI